MPGELGQLLGRGYPTFVTTVRAQIDLESVPVFMFHNVTQRTFGAQMAFLHANGYQTVTLPQFMAFLEGSFRPKTPSVLLTFDDGDTSWYDIALPVLQQYQFHAVGFVVPYFIRDTPHRANGFDWLSWPELREMHASGAFDFQSHGYRHAKLFTGPELTGFYAPEFDRNALGLNVPWVVEDGVETNALAWGAPLYTSTALLQAKPRLLDSADIRHALTAHVAARGGRAFFDRSDWRSELKTVFEVAGGQKQPVQFASQTETDAAISAELIQAKSVLESRLDKSVTHFCFPFGRGSKRAVNLSREAGYVSNFWVTRPDKAENRAGDSPYNIVRLKDDYVQRLPGRGRKSLASILGRKLRRRFRSSDIYYERPAARR